VCDPEDADGDETGDVAALVTRVRTADEPALEERDGVGPTDD
jgi:hypothetical protein